MYFIYSAYYRAEGCPVPQFPPLPRDEPSGTCPPPAEGRGKPGLVSSPLSIVLGGTQVPGVCSVPPRRCLLPGIYLIRVFGTQNHRRSCHPQTTGKSRVAAGSATCRGLPHPGRRHRVPAGSCRGARNHPHVLKHCRCREFIKLFVNDSTINHLSVQGITWRSPPQLYI